MVTRVERYTPQFNIGCGAAGTAAQQCAQACLQLVRIKGFDIVSKPLSKLHQRDLIPFLTMAFLIAWGILGLYIFAPETMVGLFGNLTGEHPLFNHSRGSILLPAFFHLQLINPLWPDAQPCDTWVFVFIAAAVVWLNRETMFSRSGAITEVL